MEDVIMKRKNRTTVAGDVVEICLSKGYVAIVDTEDYDIVSPYIWSAQVSKYTVYAQNKGTLLHKIIMKPSDGFVVDHVDGDGLNNRRSNLRICTQQENMANQHRNGRRSSRYKGVSYSKAAKCWEAYITVNYIRSHLGLYNDEKEAALSYDATARYYFGEFACPNFEGDEALPVGIILSRSKMARPERRDIAPYRGIKWHKRDKCWEARLGRTEYLGRSKDPIQAAKLYDVAAHNRWGLVAILNFPEEVQAL